MRCRKKKDDEKKNKKEKQKGKTKRKNKKLKIEFFLQDIFVIIHIFTYSHIHIFTYSTMSNTYQLSWNAKKYDWEARMHSSMADPSKRIFTQSLGRRNKPDKFNVGDIVYITCAKKCIMKGVLRTRFTQRVKISDDEFIKPSGDDRDVRHVGRWYCEIEITDWFLGKHQRTMRGNQTTFCQPTNPFWEEE